MKYIKELLQKRHAELDVLIKKNGRRNTDNDVLSEFYELDAFIKDIDSYESLYKGLGEAYNRGYANGFPDGANEIISSL